MPAPPEPSPSLSNSTPDSGLVRGIGLWQATALNMIDMIGVGPFVTIPLMVATMHGPQAMVGWVLGALLVVCDGLVWAERSEEHTSELQSRFDLVCRLLLEKKNNT